MLAGVSVLPYTGDGRFATIAILAAALGAAGAEILQWSPTAVIAGAALLVTLVAGALVTAIPQVGGLSPAAGRSHSTTVSV